jgi:ketosteroid isomerase-like protein
MTHATHIENLRELNENYIRSVQASDAAWFEDHLAADFVNGSPDCILEERAAFIERVARPSPVTGLRADDVRIQLLGDVAIIRARTVYTKGDGSAGAGRYTDVWALRDDRWLCVSADVTRL